MDIRKENMPCVLVISHNAFSNHDSNGKTLNALFYKWDSDKIAELYFYPEEPSSTVCNNYFRITDGDIIRAFKLGDKQCGQKINSNKSVNQYEINKDYNMMTAFRKRNLSFSSLLFILRDILWGFKFWRTDELKEWVREFKPDVIFLILANKKFSLKIAYYISELLNIPIVLFTSDDRYRIDSKRISPIYYLEKYLLRKTILKVCRNCKHIITVSEKMNEIYSSLFSIQTTTIFTPVSRSIACVKSENNKPLIMRYVGNLWLGRWRTLEQLCLAIKEVNSREIRIVFEIYSSEKNPKIIKRINLLPDCKFMGVVSGTLVPKLLEESDIVVHAEDFSPINARYTELSLSTKISDYLGAGKCILAIGPENIASMVHIKNAAKCVYKIENILPAVREIVNNKELRSNLQEKALLLAEQDHDFEKNHNLILNILRVNNYEVD